MSEEVWKPVVGYENDYEVSNCGRVRRASFARRSSANAKPGRILRPVPRRGYLRVRLYLDGKYRSVGVHNLVAAAFIGHCPDNHIPNHKDGIKTNCSASNLEYLTQGDNHRHAYATGLKQPPRGERQGAHKLTWTQVREIRRRLTAGEKQIPLARQFGISQSQISEIKLNTTWIEEPHVATGERVKVPDEETFFRLAGVGYVKPEERR